MKKSILSVALFSMLFVLGACSATDKAEEDFLNKVKGKYVYISKTDNRLIGTFSTDGEKFDTSEFDKATDENTGVYSGTKNFNGTDYKLIYTFKTSNGETGTMKFDGGTPDIWLESTERS